MDSAELNGAFHFGDFRVYPDRGEIHVGGEIRRIEPRVMDVLVLLASRQGEVVSRDTLIAEVWRGALISDDVISRCIYQLRKELGEKGRELIRTVPKRGYRFTGVVETVGESSAPATDAPATPTRGSIPIPALVSAAILVVVLVAAGYLLTARPVPPQSVTVAVQSFQEGEVREQNVLGPGVAEGLLYRLSRNPALTVLARASSFQDSNELAQALPASNLAVIEGEISQQGSEWLLDVRLVDVGTGSELWRTRLSTEEHSISEIENRVELGILQALRALPEGLTLPGTGFASDDLVAYENLLRGRELIRTRDPEALQEALRLFSSAVALDPDYAAAYAAIAEVSAHLSIYAGRNWADYRETATASIEQALQLDGDSAYAHAVKGLVHFADDKSELAEPALRKAIELNPGFAEPHAWLGLVYMDAGRMREALDVHQTSAVLSPLSSTAQMNIGMAYQSLGELDNAIRHFEKTVSMTPEYANAYWATGYAYWQRGVLSKATEFFQRADELELVNADFFAQYALVHFEAGLDEPGRRYAEKANRIDPTRLWSLRASWASYLIDDDLDELLDRFQKLADGNSPGTSMPLSIARGHAIAGRWQEASDLYETYYETADPWFFYHWDAAWGTSHGLMLAIVRKQLGQDPNSLLDRVEALAESFGEQAASSAGLAYLEATSAAVRGDHEQALEHLELAHALGWRRWWWTEIDPGWADLRDSERFSSLLEELRARPEPRLDMRIAASSGN